MSSQDKRRSLSEFAELDWDFSGESGDDGFARFHWHPARFIPQLPAITIAALSDLGERVLDPFCGSGTTLVEARLRGRHVLGIDTNPVATMMTAAKIAPFEQESFKAYVSEVLQAVDRALGGFGAQLDGIGDDTPQLEEQRRWYHERTLAELATIWRVIETSDSCYRLAASASFSAVLRSVCSQAKHWGWICDNVRPKEFTYKDAVAAFAGKLQEYGHSAANLSANMLGNADVEVKQDRCAEVLADYPTASFDLAVTSPPYFGVTDYAKAQRLSYLWFGFPLEAARLSEAGARSKRRRLTARAEFLQDMEDSFIQIARVLRPGAFCVLVIGESPARDTHLQELEEVVESCGLHIEERIDRRFPTQRGIVATLKSERLVVCCRE